MADWKQITARIRRARTSKDPVGQLSNLYEKTRDAMVAFELGKLFENSQQNDEAAKWYSAAAERFRRADWKTKAQEAVVRLGGSPGETSSELPVQPGAEIPLAPPMFAAQENNLALSQDAQAMESVVTVSSEVQQAVGSSKIAPSEPRKSRRHRGRRGGRNRRRRSTPGEAVRPVESPSQDGDVATPDLRQSAIHSTADEPSALRTRHSRAIPSLPVEPVAEPPGTGLKGRYGDPGLSSRISLLEMQFRRLMACPPARLDEADRAPAGPGVMVLTDSDLTTYYYVEACQTLRIAIANLLRGGSSRRGDSIKPRLAEHLGIPESRVSKYLAEHCVVRWLQLDEGASNFAHFVIAVLRPALND